MAEPRGVKPTVDAWRRTSKAVRAWENAPVGSPRRGPSGVSAPPTWVAFGTVSEEIAAGSWGAPGEGKATLEHNGREVDVINRLVDEDIAVGVNLIMLWTAKGWHAFATCDAP
ncbi:hypothetical protein [Paludisphaera sp.]|uniref:hypothetical protein n=1 Tax=Paludisphaera sp. TaxID=2017432 RepID=UPI00301C67EF